MLMVQKPQENHETYSALPTRELFFSSHHLSPSSRRTRCPCSWNICAAWQSLVGNSPGGLRKDVGHTCGLLDVICTPSTIMVTWLQTSGCLGAQCKYMSLWIQFKDCIELVLSLMLQHDSPLPKTFNQEELAETPAFMILILKFSGRRGASTSSLH